MWLSRRETGQAAVEFGIFGIAFLMLTVGLIDVGRGFYQYNAISTAARYGARWASVVGGACSGPNRGASNNDWCNELGSTTTDFWHITGNYPLQGNNFCPKTIDDLFALGSTKYYRVSDYMSQTSTTVVGAIGQKFDTDANSSNFIKGGLTPGFDLSQLYVCIQFPSDAFIVTGKTSDWRMGYGNIVTVFVYYRFVPAGPLFGNVNLDLIASSQYQVEG